MLQQKYEVARLIGTGGEAKVYEARMMLPRGQSHPVAIKMMRLEHCAAETALTLTTREALTSLQLCHNHPNLVTVYDFDQTRDGRLYCVMEYVDGVTLRDIGRSDVDSSERFFAIVRRIARTTLFALTHLHGHGVLHRDVKPSNILLGRDGVIKLADLGITKRLDSERSERFRGTFAYSSPDAFKNGPPSVSWDLHSLGVTLYELIVGDVPFGRTVPEEVLAKSMNGAPALPHDTPQDLVGLIYGLLAHSHKERIFASADECVRYLASGPEIASATEIASLVERVASRVQTPEPGDESALPDLAPHKTRSRLAWVLSAAAAAVLIMSLGLNGVLLASRAAPGDSVATRLVQEPITEAQTELTPDSTRAAVCESPGVVAYQATRVAEVIEHGPVKPTQDSQRRPAPRQSTSRREAGAPDTDVLDKRATTSVALELW